MSDRVRRRSWLLVPASRPVQVEEAAASGADVVVLDLVELVADRHRAGARESVAAGLRTAAAGGAQVYVQIDPGALDADLDACVHPGLAGVVISRAESPQTIERIDARMTQLERARGVGLRCSIVPAVETAAGNHAAYEIACASPRVNGITLGRADLIMDLRPEPSGELHLLPYLMQRLIVIAGAARVAPIGAWWRAPDRGLLATPENTLDAARRGRAIGFRGAMCLRADQVPALNATY